LPPKEGGGAPNGAPQLPRLDAQAQPRPDKRDRSPFGAPPRSCAGSRSRLGLGRASWNHRMQTGGPSPAPVQRAPRSPDTRRTGRCPNRLKAKSDERCPQEPHPLRQSASPVDVPYDERDGRCYPNPHSAVKGFSIYADKSRGCAARLPLRASPDAFHSILKIRKSEVAPVNQGFLYHAQLFGAARRQPNCTARRRSSPD
jgi:hypothetical protein